MNVGNGGGREELRPLLNKYLMHIYTSVYDLAGGHENALKAVRSILFRIVELVGDSNEEHVLVAAMEKAIAEQKERLESAGVGAHSSDVQELVRKRFIASAASESTDRQVLRQEHKYLMSLDEYKALSGKLSQCLTEDDHNGGDGYMVRSLYFDTLQNNDYTEKEDGTELRRKIRLRIYDTSASVAYLEIKQKQGMYQLKRSMRLSRSDAGELARGRYSVLLKYDSAFAAECFALLNMYTYRPKAIVQYLRKAFVAHENNIRITFDHTITATEGCTDIFSNSLCLTPVMDAYGAVMEVKYNGFLLTYIKELLFLADKLPTSVGKYYMARRLV